MVKSTGSPAWTTTSRRASAAPGDVPAAGATVVLLAQPPFVDLGKVSGPTVDDAQFDAMNRLLADVAATWARRSVVDIDLSAASLPGRPAVQAGRVRGLGAR